MTLHMKDGGSWKTATPYVREGGVWKAPAVYVKDAGVWKLVHSPVSVSINPTQIDASDATFGHVFNAVTANIQGGSATSYTWSFINVAGGVWSLQSGQGTATVFPQVGAVGQFELATATLKCDMVINGQTYTVTCALSYYNEGNGLPEN